MSENALRAARGIVAGEATAPVLVVRGMLAAALHEIDSLRAQLAAKEPPRPVMIVKRPMGRFDLFENEDDAWELAKAMRADSWYASEYFVNEWIWHPKKEANT